MAEGLRWIDSLGGPLLLLDRLWLPYWRGHFETSADEPPTDYERACAIDELLGLLPTGPGVALVLDDEPLSTAWWPLPETRGGIIIRWRFAPDKATVLAALPHLHRAAWVNSNLTLPLPTGQALLFDATERGDEEQTGARLAISLPPGMYDIDTAEYAPEPKIALLLHRLTYNHRL